MVLYTSFITSGTVFALALLFQYLMPSERINSTVFNFFRINRPWIEQTTSGTQRRLPYQLNNCVGTSAVWSGSALVTIQLAL